MSHRWPTEQAWTMDYGLQEQHTNHVGGMGGKTGMKTGVKTDVGRIHQQPPCSGGVAMEDEG